MIHLRLLADLCHELLLVGSSCVIHLFTQLLDLLLSLLHDFILAVLHHRLEALAGGLLDVWRQVTAAGLQLSQEAAADGREAGLHIRSTDLLHVFQVSTHGFRKLRLQLSNETVHMLLLP